MSLPADILEPLRALHEMGALDGRGDLVRIECPFFGDPRALGLRRRFLAAVVRRLQPLRLRVADPEAEAAELDRLGLARDGDCRILTAAVDLEVLDRAVLHAGAWFIYKSSHADLLARFGAEDPFRSQVLADLVRRRDASLIVASFYDDREWLVAGLT